MDLVAVDMLSLVRTGLVKTELGLVGPLEVASSNSESKSAVPVLLVCRSDKVITGALGEVMVELPAVGEERPVTTHEHAEPTRETSPWQLARYEGTSAEEICRV